LKRVVLVPSVLALSVAGAAAGSPASIAAAAPALAASPNMKLGNPASSVTLAEDGSTLLQPHLQHIADGFHKSYPNVTINPAGGGSGKGITDATSGVTQFGGSDAYLPPTDFRKYPTVENIPVAVSSQSVDYNLPGIRHQAPEAERQRHRPDLPGQDHHLEQLRDQEAEPRAEAAGGDHRAHRSLGLLG
jgi:ABC-type phosphate transport system substrate-binding protein